MLAVLGHDDVAIGGQHGHVGEREGNTVIELPVTEVNRPVPVIVQLYILVVVIERDRVVHDLVDDDRVLERCGIRLAGRWLRKMIPLRASVHGAAERIAVRLRSVMERVEHAIALGVEQPNHASVGRKLEAKRGFTHRKGSATCQCCILGKSVFLLIYQVGERHPG